MRKYKLLFFLYLGSQSILSAQLDVGKYSSDESYFTYTLELKEDNWFVSSFGSPGGAYHSNGYYFELADTLLLINTPVKGYGSKSYYESKYDSLLATDSLRISLMVLDLDSTSIPHGRFMIIENDRSEDPPILVKRILTEYVESDDQGIINIVLPLNWEGEIVSYDPAFNHLSIPILRGSKNFIIEAFLSPGPPTFHEGYNSEHSLDKFLIIQKGGLTFLKSIGKEREIQLKYKR